MAPALCPRRRDRTSFTAEEIKLCTDEDIPVFLAHGVVLDAWSIARREMPRAPPRCRARSTYSARQARAAFFRTGMPFTPTICPRAAITRRACARLDHAFAEMEATHERWAEPELHRIRGLLLERNGESAAAVEACHRRALASARQRGASAWALRAATNLAACLRAQGRATEARDALEQALSEGARCRKAPTVWTRFTSCSTAIAARLEHPTENPMAAPAPSRVGPFPDLSDRRFSVRT